MDSLSFLLLILMCVLNATSSILIKKIESYTVIAIAYGGTFICALYLICVVPFVDLAQLNLQVLPFFATAVFLHAPSLYMISKAYSAGHLSVIYPMSRGTTIIFITSFVILFEHQYLNSNGVLGVALILIGLITITLHSVKIKINSITVLYAIIIALLTSGYTIIDSVGSTMIPTHIYVGITVLLRSLTILGLTKAVPRYRLQRGVQDFNRYFLYGCMISFVVICSYCLTLHLMQNHNSSYVAAMRELTMIIITICGLKFFNEKLTFLKALAILLIISGALVIKIS